MVEQFFRGQDAKMRRCVENHASTHLRLHSSLLLFALYSLLFTFYFLHSFAMAATLDTSVDDEIRKKYNPSKLEEDMSLPALPKVLNENTNDVNVKVYPVKNVQPKVCAKTEQSFIRLKKGTKIKLKLLNNVSDATQKGTKLTFSSIRPVTTTYFTIPEGTIFKGYVVNSHKPQLSANGGLIVININSMIINDEVQPINANVVKANHKHIFRNNIKGKRTYVKSMLSSAKPGYNFYIKMLNIAASHMTQQSGLIITPLSLASGVLVWGGNVFASPALAMFHKGGSIALREGSEVDVKLMQDIFIYQ